MVYSVYGIGGCGMIEKCRECGGRKDLLKSFGDCSWLCEKCLGNGNGYLHIPWDENRVG